jgi:hypothetical protein
VGSNKDLTAAIFSPQGKELTTNATSLLFQCYVLSVDFDCLGFKMFMFAHCNRFAGPLRAAGVKYVDARNKGGNDRLRQFVEAGNYGKIGAGLIGVLGGLRPRCYW